MDHMTTATTPPQVGETRMMVCPECGLLAECTYDADPFREDIHADATPVWECAQCRYESARDI
jgi:hypothetical protein